MFGKYTITHLALILLVAGQLTACKKPYPTGLYESTRPVLSESDITIPAAPIVGQEGALVRVAWNLCDDNPDCLYSAIQQNLDRAQETNIKVALAIGDGDFAPTAVKNDCANFSFMFDGVNRTMCLPWDTRYLEAKKKLIAELARRFDTHKALAYIYFTGACSTNGFEGHCRVNQQDYAAAGFTQTKLSDAYVQIMTAYKNAFVKTPIVFEVHSLFNSAQVWQNVWAEAKTGHRVGVAAWWCAEGLSVRGNDTAPVWPIVQEAAATSFSVCQTLKSFTRDPYKFSNALLGLDYGEENDWDETDSFNALSETLTWAEGAGTHAGQSQNIAPFAVLEAWSADIQNSVMQDRLGAFPAGQ